jgi:uncharacterized membrane protein YczE
LPNRSNRFGGTAARTALYVSAVPCIVVGITLMLRSKLGASPYDTLISGLSNASGFSVGTMFLTVAAIATVIGWRLGVPPGPGTVFGALAISPFINVALDTINVFTGLSRFPAFVGGMLLLSAGVSMVVASNLGPGPTEIAMIVIVRKGLSVKRTRWLTDAVCLATGGLLGGVIGIGTVVALVAMGPTIAVFLRLLGWQAQAHE